MNSAIRGCSCLRAISIDDQYTVEYANYAKNFLDVFKYNGTTNTTIAAYKDEDITKFYRCDYNNFDVRIVILWFLYYAVADDVHKMILCYNASVSWCML